jgi:hypothetical protein
MASNMELSFPIIQACTTHHNASFVASIQSLLLYGSLIQHVIVLGLSWAYFFVHHPTQTHIIQKECLNACLFQCLFQTMDSLTAFSVYFGIWHSITSMMNEVRYLKDHHSVLVKDVYDFYHRGIHGTMIAFGFMVILYLVTSSTMTSVAIWATFFRSISILTGPHLWVTLLPRFKKINT